jgi:hypothetical protein
VNGRLVKLAVKKRLCRGPRDPAAVGQRALVLTSYFRVGDPGVDHRHIGAAMAEDRHDRLDACTAFGELRTEGVSESMGTH